MVIDINSNGISNAQARARAQSQQAADRTDTAASKAPQNTLAADEQVQLSSQASTMQRVEAKIQSMPDVDMDKVERIKQQIANGEFAVNADRIAGKLLQEEIL